MRADPSTGWAPAAGGKGRVIFLYSAEAALERELEVVNPHQAPECIAAELLQMWIKNREDVPMVEDFPLHPEEETEDFQHLATTLDLRFIRAVEHWRGNTHLTLTEIIMRSVEDGMRAQEKKEQRKPRQDIRHYRK